MNINFVVVVVVVSFQRVTFTFQLHVNPRMFPIKKKIKKCHQKLHGDQKKNKKEQKRTKKNKKTETGTTKKCDCLLVT